MCRKWLLFTCFYVEAHGVTPTKVVCLKQIRYLILAPWLKLVFVVQDIMTGYREFVGLSPQSGAIIDHLNSPPKLQRSLLSSLSPEDSSPGLSVETSVSSTKSSFDITVDNKCVSPVQTASKPRASCPLLFWSNFFFYPMHYECYYCLIFSQDLDEETDECAKKDDTIVSSPTSPSSISLQSPKAMEMAGCIIKFEKKQREKAQVTHHSFL